MNERKPRGAALPHSLPPIGLGREVAAAFIGVGPSKVDQMVADGRMPAPKLIDGLELWDQREVEDAFAALDRRETPTTPLKLEASKDTFADLCREYMASTDFISLAKRTTRVRRQILQHCIDEIVDEAQSTRLGTMDLRNVDAKTLCVLRDRKAAFPEAANGRVKAVRAVFTWACRPEVGIVHTNPARDVRYRASGNPDGHHTWTIEEVEQFEERHSIGTKARLAMGLLLYTGQRRSDIVLFGTQHEKDGWLRFTQQKNKLNDPRHLEIPIRPELREIIDASPTGDILYLVTEFKKGFSVNGFGNKFREWCDEVGEPDAEGIPPLHHCSAHGLRKACATRLADNGAAAHEIMAITGHKTMKEVERYTRSANQKRLAESASKKLTPAGKATYLASLKR